MNGSAPPGDARLTIVSGPSGCGKTSWCLALKAQAEAAGVRLEGVISPPVFVDGVKVAIDVVTLDDGVVHRLGDRHVRGTPNTWGLGWDFDQDVIRQIDDRFASIQRADWLMIDEIGPLELRKGGGWGSAVMLIDEGRYGHAFVVIRPDLVDDAAARWPNAEVLDLSSTSTVTGGRGLAPSGSQSRPLALEWEPARPNDPAWPYPSQTGELP